MENKLVSFDAALAQVAEKIGAALMNEPVAGLDTKTVADCKLRFPELAAAQFTAEAPTYSTRNTMSKPILLGLTGPTGVGKDTIAGILGASRGFVRLAFADVLKDITRTAFDLSDGWLTDDWKTTVHPYWGLTPREMMQKTGTEAFQGTFGGDFWIRRMQRVYESLQDRNVVITDVRNYGAQTEPAWVRAQGGIVVHVEGPQRRGDVSAAHVSNLPVDFVEGDKRLLNTHDMITLKQHVSLLMKELEMPL
jgi:hypothetical protein